jgi:tRNA synthetases class I (I, L, M and V)
VHPVDGRRLPIITETKDMKMELGTGAVKITPAHDPKDFERGQKHGLEFMNIFNDDGTMNFRCGRFAGRPRYEVRICLSGALCFTVFCAMRRCNYQNEVESKTPFLTFFFWEILVLFVVLRLLLWCVAAACCAALIFCHF